jgi:iron complex transport system ATP-binding protein
VAEAMRLLEVEGLEFGPAGRPLAAPLSFSLEAGRCLVLLGPNGAGKTSLLRTLIGSLPALAGSIHYNGRALSVLSPREVAATVAFAAPRSGDTQDFTVEQLVLLGRNGARGFFTQPRASDLAVVNQIIDRLELGSLRARRLGLLSDGERQLASIARALAQQAQVLVLDEPAASLDPGRQARLLDWVASLVAGGQAVILSTHDPNHALALADQVLIWQNPAQIIWGRTSELLKPERLEAMYGAPLRRYRADDGSAVLAVKLRERHVANERR